MFTKTNNISRRLKLASSITLSNHTSQAKLNNTPTFLSDASAKDKKWDGHRKKNTELEQIYQASNPHQCYAERMHVCSTFLDFRLVPSEDELKLKLSRAMFCHVRLCPVCQWRRSLTAHAKALTIIPKVLETYPTYRWLFITLTVKNIPVNNLRDEFKHLNESFKRLSKLKYFPGEGWIKCAEVTRGHNGTAHPHFHILMMVKPSYFGVNYLSIANWKEMWMKSTRLDYTPQVDVKAIKATKTDKTNKADLIKTLCEVVKYQVKEGDLIRDPEWILEVTDQLHKTRAISTGGILKTYFRELEQEPKDLIGNDGKDEETVAHLYAIWRRDCQRYVIKEQVNQDDV